MSGAIILGCATAIATAVGIWWHRRTGTVIARPAGTTEPVTEASVPGELRDAGLSAGTPAIVHFTADWCGPCAAVRRVITATLPEFPDVSHLELDIDDYPQLTRHLGVRSLPTTFIYDGAMQQRFRIPGVPSADALRDALIPISGHSS